MNDSEMIDEMAERIAALEQQLGQDIANLTAIIADASETSAEVTCMLRRRIEQLETCATLNAETIGYVAELRHTVAGQDKRIEELEAFHLPCAIFRLVCA